MLSGAFVAAVPAVPIVGGAALAGVALLTTIVGLLVGYGLYFAWRSTVGWLMHRLADLLDVKILRTRPFGFAARALRKGSDEVAGAFLQIARGGERAGGALFGWSAFLVEWSAREVADMSGVTAGLFARLFHTDLPAVKAESIGAAAGAAAARQRPIDRRQTAGIAAVGGQVAALDKAWRTRLRTLERGIDRIKTRDLPRVRADTRTAQRTATRTKARVESRSWWRTHIRSIAGTTFFAAAVGTALGRLGLRWLRCGNVRRVGQRLCGMPADLLELLLGTALVVFALNNLCQLVVWTQRLAVEFEDDLIAFVNEFQGLVCGGKQSAATGIVAADWERVERFPSGIVYGVDAPKP